MGNDIPKGTVYDERLDATQDDLRNTEERRIVEDQLRTSEVHVGGILPSQVSPGGIDLTMLESSRAGVVSDEISDAPLRASGKDTGSARKIRIYNGLAFDHKGRMISLYHSSLYVDFVVPSGSHDGKYLCAHSWALDVTQRSNPVTGELFYTRLDYKNDDASRDLEVMASVGESNDPPLDGSAVPLPDGHTFYLCALVPQNGDIVIGRIQTIAGDVVQMYGDFDESGVSVTGDDNKGDVLVRSGRRDSRSAKVKFYDAFPAPFATCDGTDPGRTQRISGTLTDVGTDYIEDNTKTFTSSLVGYTIIVTTSGKIKQRRRVSAVTPPIRLTLDPAEPFPAWIITPEVGDAYQIQYEVVHGVSAGIDAERFIACQGTHPSGRTVRNPLALHARDVGALEEATIKGRFFTNEANWTEESFKYCTGQAVISSAAGQLMLGGTNYVIMGAEENQLSISNDGGATWSLLAGGPGASPNYLQACDFPVNDSLGFFIVDCDTIGSSKIYSFAPATSIWTELKSGLPWRGARFGGGEPSAWIHYYDNVGNKAWIGGVAQSWGGSIAPMFRTVDAWATIIPIPAGGEWEDGYCSDASFTAGTYAWAVGRQTVVYDYYAAYLRGKNVGSPTEEWEIWAPEVESGTIATRCSFSTESIGYILFWDGAITTLKKTTTGNSALIESVVWDDKALPANFIAEDISACQGSSTRVIVCGYKSTTGAAAVYYSIDGVTDWVVSSPTVSHPTDTIWHRIEMKPDGVVQVWGEDINGGAEHPMVVIAYSIDFGVTWTVHNTSADTTCYQMHSSITDYPGIKSAPLAIVVASVAGNKEITITGLPYKNANSYYPIACISQNVPGSTIFVAGVVPLSGVAFKIVLNNVPIVGSVKAYWSSMGY